MIGRLELYGIIGVIVLALAGGGYWYVKHLQGKVAKLEEQVASLESKAEVIQKAQEATDRYIASQKQAVRANVARKSTIDQAVDTVDNPTMDQLFIGRGLLQPKASSAASGKTGNP